MKTAVDGIGQHRERRVNARFHAMTSHYLFAAEFCNRAAGWEKGRVEKNVQDRRRQIWIEAGARHWPDLDTLNAWLASECRAAWPMQAHPDASDITVAEALEDEQPHLMPMPAPFDGYIERPVRVSSTALVSFQRNRYSVPCEHAHAVASLRVYPFELAVVVGEAEVARHRRSFERDRVHYDWQHYIALVQRKPGHCVTARRSCPCPIRCASCSRCCCASLTATAPWPRCWPPYPCTGSKRYWWRWNWHSSPAWCAPTTCSTCWGDCSIRTARSRRSPRE